jgi:peptidoglycan/LPS O-acetylase OafA/YrhL
MTTAHWLLALASGVALAGTSLVTGWSFATHRPAARWIDRLILASLGAVALAALAGAGVWITQGPPADPLHLVYGALALVVLPVARYLGRIGSVRRRSGFVAGGCLVMAGVLYRLWTTAG